jgi:putative ABC transport system ATP-binding protein
MTVLLSLENIYREFQVGDQRVQALNAVSLEVEQGEYLSIMGPSGSGKSTLLHILGLLDRADRGHYRLDGEDVTLLNDQQQARIRREQIGFVFQFFQLVPRLTAIENVELPLLLAGIAVEERRERAAKIMASVGLSERINHRPDQLSGGQRQRVAIARATIMEPTLLLADEPTGNLDTQSGQEVVEIMEALQGQGLTLIVVTHDSDLGRRARRQIQMVDGQIVQDQKGVSVVHAG